jgi:hypothetical protein
MAVNMEPSVPVPCNESRFRESISGKEGMMNAEINLDFNFQHSSLPKTGAFI